MGIAWKNNNSIEIVKKINQVLTDQFTKTGYKFYIETKVLKMIKLEYKGPDTSKGIIIMMVVSRKSEISKTTIKREWNTHECKILKKRVFEYCVTKGKRRPETKQSFQIVGQNGIT